MIRPESQKMEKNMKKTGILGGTFDPIHNAHIQLALAAAAQLPLDEIIFLPSPDPPHKKERNITPFEHRFKMTALATEGYDRFVCSDYETHLPQPSYTAQTLEHLTAEHPDTEYYFIIGEDSLDHIETWYHPEKVMQLCVLAVAGRPAEDDDNTVEEQKNYLTGRYGARIVPLSMEETDISSTDIRKRLEEGREIDGLVPDRVIAYIRRHGLYRKEK